MPISTFFGLQTSLRGLLAQQRAMDTTGHNIANANTAGYSRQEAVMTAADPLLVAAIATGVADLNRAITAALQSGTPPTDLPDRRDALLDKLAGLGRVTITDTDPVNQPR